MADSKVSALIPATTVNLTDLLLLVQAGSSLSLSIQELALGMPSRIIINEASEAPLTGALATNLLVSKITPAVTPAAYTLAAGTHGMEKEIVVAIAVAGGSAAVTVTGGSGFTSVTFGATARGAVKLKNVNGLWHLMSSDNVTIA